MSCAVVVIVKNEQSSIAEWIAYYAVMGFDAVILYNNNSIDQTLEKASTVDSIIDLTLIDWPDSSPRWQVSAYTDALNRFKDKFDWILFVDADEFIVLPNGQTIGSFLEDFKTDEAIAFPWRLFGSSGHKERPRELVIEAYTRRAPIKFGPNYHVKSIVRPGSVASVINPHCMYIAGSPDCTSNVSSGYVWPNHQEVIWQKDIHGVAESFPNAHTAWINHYAVKSMSEWELKLKRGYNGWFRGPDEFDAYDINVEEDKIDGAIVGKVKSLLGKS